MSNTNIQNTTKRRIREDQKTIGVVFGGYSPMHNGHRQQIQKAAMLNDAVVVVVSGYDGEARGDGIGLPLEKRFRYLRETFNDEPTIHVAMLDETNIPRYPNGWKNWTELLIQAVNSQIVDDIENHKITTYVGEAEYLTELGKYAPAWQVEVANRNKIGISATMIRENPIKYWSKIDRVFRRHFAKIVMVTGSASTGKSTLIRRLARSMNAPFSEEFARTYEEESNLNDSELTVKDYFEFISGQYRANSHELKSPANEGLVIFDTDAITTRVYAKLYLPKEDFDKLEPYFQDTIARQRMDLILVIPPVTKYVDDGFRAMEWEDSRYEFHNELMRQLEEFGLTDKVVLLDDTSKDDTSGFYTRYVQAIRAIDKTFGLDVDLLD